MEVVMVSDGAKSLGGFVRYVTEERRYWFLLALIPGLVALRSWDVTRFIAPAGLTCLLALVAVCPLDEGRPLLLPLWYRQAAVLAIALGMASGEGFMDSASPNLFPFRSNAVGFRSWIVNHDPPLRAK